jgi:single-stranded DNA-binding protein
VIRGIVGKDIQQSSNLLAFVIATFASHLRVLEQRAEYAKICMHKSALTSALQVLPKSMRVAVMCRLEVEKVSDENIDNNVKVVRVEILISRRRRENQVQKFENEELWTEIHLAVEDQYKVLTECSK